MTNKDWLNSLTDEEFASWVCDEEIYDFENNVYEQPSPKWDSLRGRYTSSKGGLLIWLKQERQGVDSNAWRPISFYFSEKGKHDWALVQFKGKASAFTGIPHICEWRESGEFGEGWYTQDGDDDRGMFDYLNDSCSAIAFFEWPKCSIGVDEEKK